MQALKLEIIVFLTVLVGLSCFGQVKSDSLKNFNNTIRFNVSNPVIFDGKNIILGYERILKHDQSISMNLGKLSFGKFATLNDDSLALQSNTEDIGFSFSLDYRFYLRKLNKHRAPRGVYIGPYLSYNYFKRENSWVWKSDPSAMPWKTEVTANINLVGFQLGYQFVFWDRLSVDLIMFGPGRWFYNFKTAVNTTLTLEEEQTLLEKMNQMIDQTVPGNDILLTGSNVIKGSSSSSTTGMRYVMNIGFRF